ncbi:neuronal acetylcholine receptor subunit alpha-3-like [Convolutriloba macropyga]|uniref:neuronal acetylcholine receptor subunit alpha-3-like n=1 Tax=Convolutriloba macropyga TaxID=536237 RepID=UPI003F520B4F
MSVCKILLASVLFPLILCDEEVADYYKKTSVQESLLDGYSRFIRPVKSTQTPVNVTFGVSLYRLAGFDVKAETMTTLLWQRIFWTDEILQWNLADSGDASVLRFEMNTVWRPDIFPFNDVNSYDPNMYEDAIPIKVTNEGNAMWFQPVVLTSTCSMDVRDFPYDTQRCTISYGPWQHTADEVDIFCEKDTVDVLSYTEHTQWVLRETSCERLEDYFQEKRFSHLQYELVFERLNTFYTKNLLLPNALLLGVTALVFFLPVDCGERIGYGVTLTLALCVNLMIVTEYIPETSRTFPDVGNYFLNSIILSTLAIILAALSINAHDWYENRRGDDEDANDEHPGENNKVNHSKDWEEEKERRAKESWLEWIRNKRFLEQTGKYSPITKIDWFVGVIYLLIVNLYSLFFVISLAYLK